jgi:acetyl esterase/lipase
MRSEAIVTAESGIDLRVGDVSITGYAQPIVLRLYRPRPVRSALPVIVYFHGGRFSSGSLDDATFAAEAIARAVPALVISVGYSLAPGFPFPAALEDGYLALKWASARAAAHGADGKLIGLAGHDAGGNLATGVAAMARDRREIAIRAQALLAPLLDPSMTRMADAAGSAETEMAAMADCYRRYLPNAMQRLHPYAAPIESSRLAGLPATLIASVQNDCLHIEAEKYAAALIAAGVTTEFTRHQQISHEAIASHDVALADVSAFFRKFLSTPSPAPSAR